MISQWRVRFLRDQGQQVQSFELRKISTFPRGCFYQAEFGDVALVGEADMEGPRLRANRRRGPSMLTIAHPGALAELAEERPYVADQQIGNLHSRKVAAPVELRPVRDAVAGIEQRTDGIVGGEHRDPGRRSRLRTLLGA